MREMEKRTPPFKIVVPGRVYRKDDVDATHYPNFHQVCMYVCMYVCMRTLQHIKIFSVCIYLFMYVVYICMYYDVCMN